MAALEQIAASVRTARASFCDSGSEFTSRVVDFRAYHHEFRIDFSRPKKPTDNGHISSRSTAHSLECLNAHWFRNLDEAKRRIEAWRRDTLTGLSMT